MRRITLLAVITISLIAAVSLITPAHAGQAEAARNRATFHDLFPHTAPRQWRAANKLYSHESGWQHTAQNGYCYGIPQVDLRYAPSAKWVRRYKRSATVQLRVGANYVHHRYGNYVRAWKHELATGWF